MDIVVHEISSRRDVSIRVQIRVWDMWRAAIRLSEKSLGMVEGGIETRFKQVLSLRCWGTKLKDPQRSEFGNQLIEECQKPLEAGRLLIILAPIFLITGPRKGVQKLTLGDAGFIPLDIVFL